MVTDKDKEKDADKDVDENKYLMKDNSVYLLSYPYLSTPKLPNSVTLPMSKLAELINNVRSSPLSSSLSLSLSLSLSGVGWVYMNLMNHNLVHMWLSEYKVGLLSLLGIIMGRGKRYTSGGGETVTTMGSENYIKQKLLARVPRSQPGK